MYSELRTYTSMSGFIQAHEGLWHMLGAKYIKVNQSVVIVQDEYGQENTWQKLRGGIVCMGRIKKIMN
jgi:hypothetical protein